MDDLKSVLRLAKRFEEKARELRGAVALAQMVNGAKLPKRHYRRRKAKVKATPK